MSLKRLMYVSTATGQLTSEDISALVDAAANKNDSTKVTGILAFNGRNFAQILEGAAEAVDAIYATICLDERHHALVLVAERSINDRLFPDWGMKLVPETSFDQFVDAMAR